MENERQLYFREGSRFVRLPEVGIIPTEAEEMKNATEAKIGIEGVGGFRERHIAFGDTQIPDLDQRALNSVLEANKVWQATHVWLMGDMINATTVGRFGFPADYERDLDSEIAECRGMLGQIVESVKEANPDVKIKYLEGNHEYRLQKYLDRNAREIALLKEKDGERTISLPRLLGLAEMNIDWQPYWEDDNIHNHAVILHGNIARVKAGYTAHAYLDRYGTTTIAGHTHRLAMVGRTQNGVPKWGIETGSLCKTKMEVPYVREGQADWQQGFALLGIDREGVAYPSIHPIIDGRTGFGTQVFDGRV